jgi:UPF0176 protein
MDNITIVAFYKFVTLPDYRDLRDPVLGLCRENGIKGSILLAEEGINGTIAGTAEGIDTVIAHLRSDPRLADLEIKTSYAEARPFKRMKVRLKKEIVTIKAAQADPTERVGTYVDPTAWNDLIQRDDVILIDTRNDYEYEMGTFQGAVNPETESFGEFPEYVEEDLRPKQPKKVAMFCTGGIRCEKATSYLLSQGFEEVYHLRGGILKYLEVVPKDQSLWEGDCFVFDEREAVDHDLRPVRPVTEDDSL